MKKTVILILLAVCLAFSACAGQRSGDISNEPTTESEPTANPRIIKDYEAGNKNDIPMNVQYLANYADIKMPCPLGEWCASVDEEGHKFAWRVVSINRVGIEETIEAYNSTHGEPLVENEKYSYVLVTYQVYMFEDAKTDANGVVMVDPLDLCCYSQNGGGYNTLGHVKYTLEESHAVAVRPGDVVNIRCICPSGNSNTNVGLRLCYGVDRGSSQQSYCGLYAREWNNN